MCAASEKIRDAARKAAIDRANQSGTTDRAAIVNDPSWTVRFDLAWAAGWETNIDHDWATAFRGPATVEPTDAVNDGFLLGKIRDLVRTTTFMVTQTHPTTTPIGTRRNLVPHKVDTTDLVEAAQEAAEKAARILLGERR